MLKLSFKTKKGREILDDVERFFVDKGLRTTEKGDCCIHMEGGGGYVRVDLVENGETEVTLESREWDYQVKQFAEQHRD